MSLGWMESGFHRVSQSLAPQIVSTIRIACAKMASLVDFSSGTALRMVPAHTSLVLRIALALRVLGSVSATVSLLELSDGVSTVNTLASVRSLIVPRTLLALLAHALMDTSPRKTTVGLRRCPLGRGHVSQPSVPQTQSVSISTVDAPSAMWAT